jgi:hypothetical protein
MHQQNGLDRKSLQTQLENYKLIVEVNTDLDKESLFTEEELLKKLELVQSYLNDSDEWGKRGDRAKSHDALNNASMIIEEITAVLKHLLNQDTYTDDSNLPLDQSEE